MALLDNNYLLAKNIKLIIFDVDGVLTDGGIYFCDNADEFKRFNSLDGLGIKMIKQFDIEPAIITAGKAKNVANRAKNLGIQHVYQNQQDKTIAFNDLMKKLALTPDQVSYVGDDIIDLKVMQQVALPIAVANAHDLVKQHAKMTTTKSGGNGAVREVCDFLLKAQNKYDAAISYYV